MDIQRTTATYDRSMLKPRILHIGFGAFARAHQFVYLDQLLSRQGGDWGVVAVRLNSGVEALNALDARDHRYTVIEADDASCVAREIGVITGTCHPLRDGLDALLSYFTQTDLSIVSLTITEKGYCLSAGELDFEHIGIRADLENPDDPKTAVGILVAGLARRRQAGLAGISVLSCDNLPENGRLARAAVVAFARAIDPDLADWITAKVCFPATMVDRIVPALDTGGTALLTEITGTEDPNGIVCEPFSQWVIEDDFAAGRPAWEKVGAQLVADVVPFEEMKLRMLNGAHTFLAHLGALAGHATISDCMADSVFREAAYKLMLQEQAPTLAPLNGVDLSVYADALISRFANSRLNHTTSQIATDSSAKLPQRLLVPAHIHLDRDEPWPLTALGIAGWMAYLKGRDDRDNTLPISDPLAETLRGIAAKYDGAAYVDALINLSEIFPVALAKNPDFISAIQGAYTAICEQGARNAVAACL